MSTYIQFNQPIVAQIGWVILAVPHLIFSFTLYIDSVMSWQHIPCHAFKTLLKRFRLYIEIGNPVYPVEQRGPSFMLALCTMFTAPPPRPAPPAPPRRSIAVVSVPAAETNRLCSLQRGNIKIVTRFYQAEFCCPHSTFQLYWHFWHAHTFKHEACSYLQKKMMTWDQA